MQTQEAARTGESNVERITKQDAVYFPLIASAGLFSLFLVFTFFKEYVSVILTLYAVVLGTGSTASVGHVSLHCL